MSAMTPTSASDTRPDAIACPVRQPTEQEQYRRLASAQWPVLQSLAICCRALLGYRDMLDPHDEVCAFLQAPGTMKLILMPRYSFKSCIATVGYSLWRLLRDPNLRILIYSDTNEKAEGFLSEIKHHLVGTKDRSRFREVFGAWETNPKEGVWNQSAIVVQARTNAAVEPSVDTAGLESSKVGKHYDLIIFDDLVSEKNITTPDLLAKVKQVFANSLSLLRPGGEVVIVGTRWHFGDLYGAMLADPAKYPALQTYVRRATEGTTHPFAPIGLTPEFLAQQKTIQGSYVYSALYQNEPVDDETATFKASDFAFYQPQARSAARDEWEAGLYRTAVIDPAISQASGADETAITVVGTDAQGDLYLLDLVLGHYLPSEMLDHLFRLYQRWAFAVLGIETVAFQRMLVEPIEERMRQERSRNRHFRPFHIEPLTGATQTSKEWRMRALQPYHERGAIKFPGERLETLPAPWRTLAFQMVQFPHAAQDDALDSLAYHLTIAHRGTTTRQTDAPKFSSAQWYEKEYWQPRELARRAKTPRWRRPAPPQLAFS